ncbi:MAG: 30S ribosomal protein S3 [Candidatus Diapherotrites archaeon]|uniref:30S ribosomal protein S3 n=1 Tax=Candidatus Iainarchaeum sp. TaxID=3101447 RepID=A0A7J4KVE5_9ARCH|nr:30S ribosomal protein S3P [uncultured archaeon]KHO55758.1 MAG: small subunit ribosomal protein S3 [archaeon GW2011_AR21]MBS3058273.1 30S ribosomal protein S3 [Candidatus Diapherotrites archaeon]HIH33220.1 30S ribosomal protein S3 [Candidatus Diapherotrites archaeon]
MIERTFIQQNMKKIELERYIKEQMDRAGFTQLDIVKTPLVTRIIINVTHPGLAIGKSGQNIKRITLELAEKFKIENPQLEIQEIKVPELDAKAVVDKMKTLLERGYSWRSVAYKTMHEISSKGAQGVEIILSGALGGKGERKRKQRIATGYMKKTGDQVKLVDYAKATSYPKYGAIGIKVRIVRPDTVFPDKIDIRSIISPKPEEPLKVETVEEKKEEGQKAEAKETASEKETTKEKAQENEEKEKKETKETGEKEKLEEKAAEEKIEEKAKEKKSAGKQKEEKTSAKEHAEGKKKEEEKEKKHEHAKAMEKKEAEKASEKKQEKGKSEKEKEAGK